LVGRLGVGAGVLRGPGPWSDRRRFVTTSPEVGVLGVGCRVVTKLRNGVGYSPVTSHGIFGRISGGGH